MNAFDRTPSSAEFGGYYNIPDMGVDPVLCTLPGAPDLSLDEVLIVTSKVYQVIFSYAEQRSFDSAEVRNYYSMCISEHLADRTVNVSFLSPDDCTSTLIRHLRELVRHELPLWRVRIAGSSHETAILIYPDAVRYGDLPAQDEDEILLATVIHKEKILRGGRGDFVEVQHNLLKQAIQSSLGTDDSRVKIVAEFDNYEGDFTRATLWTLCRSDTPDLALLQAKDFLAGCKFYSKENGDFGYHVGEDSPMWVREWIFTNGNIPSVLRFQAYDSSYNTSVIEIVRRLAT